MHPSLNHNLYLVKEHLGIFKAANNFDIFEPSSGEMIMECREESLGVITKLLRFSDYKRMTPFDIHVRDMEGNQVLRIRRGISIFLSKVEVLDASDQLVGIFKQKLFSIGGAFKVLNAAEEQVCELKGNWIGWDFRFVAEDFEYAHVSKKWSGAGKEFFTSADNYMLEISDEVRTEDSARQLILAAVLCIDMVLKE
ncbi:MAG: hypothetical protein ACJAZ8_002343 [Planctomycetota bacterium]|jgi:uncharacterized protein YxjI